MMTRRLLAILLTVMALLTLSPAAWASPSTDLTGANALVETAINQVEQGDTTGATGSYAAFRDRWFDIEDGVKAQSKTAYRDIEEQMAEVQLALLQDPVDLPQLTSALTALREANLRFIQGGYPADGGQTLPPTGDIGLLLTQLDEARERAIAGDAEGAASAMEQFRKSWIDVEGLVLTQSGKIYADAERDMVDAYAWLSAAPPDLERGLQTVERMQAYLAPLTGKTAYGVIDAATILLREGLEALLVVVALLGFLKKAGQPEKSKWIWGGVGAGLLVSCFLAVAVKLLIGTGAFGHNNFLIAGWTGLFAAVMLIWVSYWLHDKSNIADWNRYIREKSSAALATGNLFSLATLAFLAIFREGTETVLFYIGMASSITMRDLVLGLGLGVALLSLLAVAMLKIGLKVPLRPFFLVSSLLVFYLGFKFTGMGIHGLQLAGLLPAKVVPYLPSIDFLALYPNWQSTIPQMLLVAGAIGLIIWNRRPSRSAS